MDAMTYLLIGFGLLLATGFIGDFMSHHKRFKSIQKPYKYMGEHDPAGRREAEWHPARVTFRKNIENIPGESH